MHRPLNFFSRGLALISTAGHAWYILLLAHEPMYVGAIGANKHGGSTITYLATKMDYGFFHDKSLVATMVANELLIEHSIRSRWFLFALKKCHESNLINPGIF